MPAYLAILRDSSHRLRLQQSMPPLPSPALASAPASVTEISEIAFGS